MQLKFEDELKSHYKEVPMLNNNLQKFCLLRAILTIEYMKYSSVAQVILMARKQIPIWLISIT